jgi:hypothetical protein
MQPRQGPKIHGNASIHFSERAEEIGDAIILRIQLHSDQTIKGIENEVTLLSSDHTPLDPYSDIHYQSKIIKSI